ncbi:hypothetical protein PCASD_03862 [Puccinia coronata f. sp. avenae]|uniref:Uncharacterized protein n=2 Tax=Puccinia coronata f. sp. avenae TaxID=200324 RepID=A0A2N5V2M4_9BASI|nr:hypothetical protein PCASD_03862 [Puccinia coronata f. sp. avenae]
MSCLNRGAAQLFVEPAYSLLSDPRYKAYSSASFLIFINRLTHPASGLLIIKITQNPDTVTLQTPATPVLNDLSLLRKRSKAGEFAGQARTAIEVGSSGVKLVGDVLKLQQDLEGIIKQLIAAGMISASKKASKALDPKQNVTVTDEASETEIILSDDDLEDDDLDSKANSTQEAPSPAIRKTTQ